MLKQILPVGCALLFACAAAAHADTVTDPTSGVSYTLSYAASGTPDVYNVYLTVDTSGYDGPSTKYPDFLDDVALQLAAQDSDYSMTVVSAPAGYATSVVDGGLNGSGCNASGNGFYCLDYIGAGLGLPTGSAGDVYNFEFAVTDTSGLGGKDGLYTNGDSNVEANYAYLNTNTGNVGGEKDNDTITMSPAPEPSSIALLGTALLGAALLAKKFTGAI